MPPAEPRFWAKVNAEDGAACWNWKATVSEWGYGQFYLAGKLRYAHRVAYEYCIGPVPPGMQVDHLCLNKRCVNPAHLEPVSGAENRRRVGRIAAQVSKTHCLRGHELSGDNLCPYQKAFGKRSCLACIKLRAQRRAAAS